MADFAVNIVLKARDEARATIRALQRDLVGLQRSGGRGGRGGAGGAGALGGGVMDPLGGGGRRGDRLGGVIGDLNASAMAVNRLTAMTRGALAAPLDLAANFEQSMAEVRAVTSDALLGDNFDKLIAKARELGASTEFTAQEVSQGLKFMGVAGFDTAEQLGTISPLLDAATISGAELGQVSDIVTDVMGGFGLGAEEATMAVDSMVATTLNANTNLLQLGRGLFKVAPLAKKVGISIHEVNATLGVLANAGIKGAEGGTVMRNMLLAVSGKPTKDMEKALRKLGLSSKELRKILDREGLEGALGAINTRFQELPPSMQLFAANVLFGKRTAAGATEILSKLTTGYEDLKEKTEGSAGAAAETAKGFRDTAKGGAKELKSALEDLGITIGNELLPILRPLMDDVKEAVRDFSKWAQANPDLLRTLGKVAIGIVGVGTVLGPVLLSISSLLTLFRVASPILRGFGNLAGGLVARNLKSMGGSASKTAASMRLIGAAGGAIGIALAAAGVTVSIFEGKLAKLRAQTRALAGHVGGKEHEIAAELSDEDLAAREKAIGSQAERERARADREQKRLDDEMFGAKSAILGVFGGDELNKADDSAAQQLEAQFVALRDERLRREKERRDTRRSEAELATAGGGGRQGLDVNGKVRIVVDDKRAFVDNIEESDLPLEVETGTYD